LPIFLLRDNIGRLVEEKDWPTPRFQRIDLSSTKAIHSGDWTVFLDKKGFLEAFSDVDLDPKPDKAATRKLLERINGLDGEASFTFADGLTGRGRYNVARAFDGWFAVTLRAVTLGKVDRPNDSPAPITAIPDAPGSISLEESHLGQEVDSILHIGNEPRGLDLASSRAYGECLFESLPNTNQKGLILISGSTGSGKTTFLNALLRSFLMKLVAGYRSETRQPGDNIPAKPHVVAIGDPVETWLFQDDGKNKLRPDQIARRQHDQPGLPIRFTARTIGGDVGSVDQATQDALRQTPSVFIISELRRDSDFRAALRFAGTGHLVLATAHATSLVDAMARLMRVEKVDSSRGRALLAQRLVALVFLKPWELREHQVHEILKAITGRGRKSALTGYTARLPRVWRANVHGCRTFVSERLSSLHVSGRVGDASHEPGVSSYSSAVERLKKKVRDDLKEDCWAHLTQVAHRWDLFQDPES